MPERVQLSRKKGWKMPDNTVRVAYSWIIATRRAMFDHCCARPAIPFSAGMRRRPTRSSASSATSTPTVADQPCHADVLLELANATPEEDR